MENKWINFFDEIFVINLTKRVDRLLRITEDFEKYQIPFTRISAVYSDNGAEGLKETMAQLFAKCIEEGRSNILVFEDDCKIVVPPELFHHSMENVVNQLPENYVMCFLGCQITSSVSHFFSSHLLQAHKMFSTHAVAYSLQGMKEIISHGFYAPIDNCYVDGVEKLGRSYVTHPLLCSQYEGYSDICKNEINWQPFIEPLYQRKIAEFNGRR